MEFSCPLNWHSLTKTDKENEKHCNACNKIVTNVLHEDDLQKLASEGQCVTFVEVIKERPYRRMGKVAYRPGR